MRPTILSLFSGIGGLDMGLEVALGARTVAQVDCFDYARAVLGRHWPAARRFEDVRTVQAMPGVTLLAGGSPCQDLSLVGFRRGLAGSRSGLWSHFLRLIQGSRPAWVVWENVAGALFPRRPKTGALDRQGLAKGSYPAAVGMVLLDLHRAGYDAYWTTITAEATGAPHRRLRVFVLAWRRDAAPVQFSPLDSPFTQTVLAPQWPAPPEEARARLEPQIEIPRAAAVLYHRERVSAVGNCVVPQAAFVAGALVERLELARQHGAACLTPSLLVSPRPRRRPGGRRSETPTEAAAEAVLALEGLLAGDNPLMDYALLEDAPNSRSPWPAQGFACGGRAAVPAVFTAPPASACAACGEQEADAPSLWPTPTVRDWRSGKRREFVASGRVRGFWKPLSEVAAPGGVLNPDWVDTLGGFPAGYTFVAGRPTKPALRGAAPLPGCDETEA